MSDIFIIGATGGVGSRLTPMLVEAGHRVTALHRKPEQADALRNAGAKPCPGDIIEISIEDLTTAMRGSDIIVFTAGAAGSGPDRTSAIDGDGVAKMIAAARAGGIARIYLVSAFMDALRANSPSENFEHYMSVKRQADSSLAATELEWVILRPGTLVSEDASGLVNAGLAVPYGTVARGNVAAMLAKLIDTAAIRREIIELTDGDTPVREAVNSLVR